MKSKKIIAILAAMAMMLSTAACGSSSKDEEDLDDLTEEEANEILEGYEEETENTKDDDDEDEKEAKSEAPVTEIDPFEDLEVTFDGTAPYTSTVSVDGGNSAVEYTLSTEEGVSNGDTVTVTAELPSTSSGFKLTETTKDYTVEGLASYVMSADEIPTDTYDKMTAQADDAITAECAGYDVAVLKSSELIGSYWLSAKSDDVVNNAYNGIYLVYKVTTEITGVKVDEGKETEETGTETFYMYYLYNNILLLADGTCSLDLSSGVLCTNTFDSDYGYWDFGYASHYCYHGYSDLDTMFNDCVAQYVDKYTYESTVTE